MSGVIKLTRSDLMHYGSELHVPVDRILAFYPTTSDPDSSTTIWFGGSSYQIVNESADEVTKRLAKPNTKRPSSWFCSDCGTLREDGDGHDCLSAASLFGECPKGSRVYQQAKEST